jgi:hypothetical protein
LVGPCSEVERVRDRDEALEALVVSDAADRLRERAGDHVNCAPGEEPWGEFPVSLRLADMAAALREVQRACEAEEVAARNKDLRRAAAMSGSLADELEDLLAKRVKRLNQAGHPLTPGSRSCVRRGI